MLGIDIVDLKDKKIQPRDERAFRLIQHPDDALPDHPQGYWLLWSAKEAVFKCKRDAYNFAPTDIPIALSTEVDHIRFSSGDLKGKILVSEKYVLAICSDDLTKLDFQVIESDEEIHSEELRASIVSYFDGRYSIGSDALNLPIILPGEIPISLSHHNQLGAFIYPKSLTD